mgnify:CR=1 FL=1
MEHTVFNEISLIIVLATVIALLMRLLKQPSIIGHIITGILVGPFVFDLTHSEDTINLFANIGIVLLLFIVGLGLNPNVIKEVGKVALITGLGQVLFTSAIGYLIVIGLGFSAMSALFMSIALAFSSTIIILKLLSDKHEQNRLYGKIAIGFLLVQDIIAALALLIVSVSGNNFSSVEMYQLVINGIWISALMALISMKILPKLSNFVSASQELLFLFAISWGLGFAALFSAIGFSMEVGALFAGVALASLPYAQEVSARLRPLRDFFIVLFFIALGAQLQFDGFAEIIPEALILSLFVLIGNPLIVLIIMGIMGYTKKTSFKAGLVVAQIREFSIVSVLRGYRSDMIPRDVVSIVTLVAIITIALSTYMIIYADKLYGLLEKNLRLFERKKAKYEQKESGAYTAVLFGFKKGGREYIKEFQKMNKKFVVIDYDPEVIDQLDQLKVHYIYGDVNDVELLGEIDLEKTQLVVSIITNMEINKLLISQVKAKNEKAVIICHCDTASEAQELYEQGATYVVVTHAIGSERITSFIRRNGLKKTAFDKHREKHISQLESQVTEEV